MRRHIIFLTSALLMLAPLALYAAGSDWAGLVPCGRGSPQQMCQACDLVKLVQNIMNWLITYGLPPLFAIIIAIAGFKMVTSRGNEAAVSEARQAFMNIIIGLIIILAAWLVIDTIMKMFVNQSNMLGPWYEIKCVAQPEAKAGAPGGVAPAPKPPVAGTLSHADALAQLKAAGISVIGTNGIVLADCTGVSGCTSLQGMQQATVQDIIDLYNDCDKCKVVVTGGTESGHGTGTYSHANGYKYDVGLNTTLNNFITSNYTPIGTRSDGAAQYQAPDGSIYAKEGNHWDVTVKGGG